MATAIATSTENMDQPNTNDTAGELAAGDAVAARPETESNEVVTDTTDTAPVPQPDLEAQPQPSDPVSPTPTLPASEILDANPAVGQLPETPEKEPASSAIPELERDAEKPALNVDASSEQPVAGPTSPRPPGISGPKTPRRMEGLNGLDSPLDADGERRSGWRTVKRHATHTFSGSQPSDHAPTTTARPIQAGAFPYPAPLGTELEKSLYNGSLDRRERELDRRERELDRRERELERVERDLERRRRELDQDRARWETQAQSQAYMQAVAQPHMNKSASSQDSFPAQWQTALDSFKKSLQAQILFERREAESALESRIMRRVTDEIAKERKVHEVMQMSDQEVNELMEDTVGHWLRKDEDVADNIRFQSLLHLAQEKMAAVSGIQLLPDTDSWALSWRLAIGPSFITQERYNKAMEMLKDKEVDDAAKAVIDSRSAMEFIVEWTTHLRKDESFIPGRITRNEYLGSVRRQVDKLNLDEQAFMALVDFVAPN